MLKLVVDDIETKLVGTFPYKDVYMATSFLPDGHWFNPYVRSGKSDGRKRLLKAAKGNKPASIPTGLLKRVTDLLNDRNWAYEIEDQRGDYYFEPTYVLADAGKGSIDLSAVPFDYQAMAVDAVATYGRGIVKVATNGGKTEIGAAVIKSANKKALWLINRQLLAYQTRDRLQERLGVKVGFIGDSVYEPADVVVGMTQSLSTMLKNKDTRFDFLRDFQVLVFDECHHVESKQWFGLSEAIAAPIRVGLSATPTEGGYGLYLEGACGPILCDIDSQELIRRGVSTPPNFWFVTNDTAKIPAKTKGKDLYDQGVVYNKPRNAMICHVAKVMVKERKPPLILVTRIVHVDQIHDELKAAGVKVHKITGSVAQDKRKEILAGLRTGSTEAVVAMVSVMAEGVDVGDIRSVINATGVKGGAGTDSECGRQVIQIVGRGLRKSKPSDYLPPKTEFDYVDFLDLQHNSLKKASLSRLSTLEGEGYGSRIKRWSDYKLSAA